MCCGNITYSVDVPVGIKRCLRGFHHITSHSVYGFDSGIDLLVYTFGKTENKVKGTLNSFMAGLKKVELIVIGELGLVPLHKDAAQLMFQVISECYERKSLIITSNLEFSGWNTVLGDNRLTAALIDRLVHHSHIVIFSGERYRLQQSMK